MITSAPVAARAIYTLSQAYSIVRYEIKVASADGRVTSKVNSSVGYVRDFLQSQNHYFAVIEWAAENLLETLASHFRAIAVKQSQ